MSRSIGIIDINDYKNKECVQKSNVDLKIENDQTIKVKNIDQTKGNDEKNDKTPIPYLEIDAAKMKEVLNACGGLRYSN